MLEVGWWWGGGVVGWWGGGVVGWWGGGGWGSLRDLSKNILKQGWVKAKVVRRGGGGFEGVTTSVPLENFNHTQSIKTLFLKKIRH